MTDLLYYSKGSKSAPTTTDHQANQDLFGYGVGLHEVAARKFAQDLVALLGDNGGFFSRDTHELEIDPIQFATYKVTSTREFIEGWYSTLSYKFKVDRVHLETLLGHSGGYYSSYGDTPEFDPVRLATDRLARIRETSSGNIARFYPHPSHGLGFYLDEGNPNYVFVIDPYEVTTYTRSKEISTGSAAGYYPTPGYGLEAGLVVPVKTVVFNYSVDHSSVPSHKLDAGLVKSITAFASVQETSYELDVSLEKPITNALAWIEGGIDTVGKIVSLFHWYVARPAPGSLA